MPATRRAKRANRARRAAGKTIPQDKAKAIVSSELYRELELVAGFSPERLLKLRIDVNALLQGTPPGKKEIVTAFLRQVNEVAPKKGVVGSNSHNHPMTDHAFCRGLERLHGIDMERVKARAVQQAEEAGMKIIRRGEQVVTVF